MPTQGNVAQKAIAILTERRKKKAEPPQDNIVNIYRPSPQPQPQPQLHHRPVVSYSRGRPRSARPGGGAPPPPAGCLAKGEPYQSSASYSGDYRYNDYYDDGADSSGDGGDDDEENYYEENNRPMQPMRCVCACIRIYKSKKERHSQLCRHQEDISPSQTVAMHTC